MHWDSRYGPYEEGFTPSVDILEHYMPLMSTNLFIFSGVVSADGKAKTYHVFFKKEKKKEMPDC